jgi:hypothetical protein
LKRIAPILALIVFIPALIVLIGFARMNDEAARSALESQLTADCLDGSAAKPDEVYCSAIAQTRTNTYTGMGFMQQVFHRGSYGIIPPYLYDVPAMREAEYRLEAEKFAQRQGPDGSTHFTGQNVDALQAEIETLAQSDPLTLQLAEQKKAFCDPSTGQIEKARKEQGDEAIDRILASGYCDADAPAP